MKTSKIELTYFSTKNSGCDTSGSTDLYYYNPHSITVTFTPSPEQLKLILEDDEYIHTYKFFEYITTFLDDIGEVESIRVIEAISYTEEFYSLEYGGQLLRVKPKANYDLDNPYANEFSYEFRLSEGEEFRVNSMKEALFAKYNDTNWTNSTPSKPSHYYVAKTVLENSDIVRITRQIVEDVEIQTPTTPIHSTNSYISIDNLSKGIRLVWFEEDDLDRESLNVGDYLVLVSKLGVIKEIVGMHGEMQSMYPNGFGVKVSVG
jgi:hypothetical protein